MFRRLLPLFWSQPNTNKKEIRVDSDDEFRDRSVSDPAPQAKKASKKKQRSSSMKRELNKLTKKENTVAATGKSFTFI